MASTSVVFDILARDRASDKFDHLGRSIDGSSSKMSKFTGIMKTAGRAAAYGLGAGLVIAAGSAVKFAQAAAEDETAATLLAGALEKNAGASKKQVAGVEEWITAIGRAKGVTDDDLRPALGRLVTATHDVGKAQLLAQVAMDVSAGSGKSLEQVSTALMKAQNGQVSSLSRLGINTKNAAGETITMDEAVQRMSETFGGAASEKANTLQGKMDRLKILFSETGETLGAKLIPIATKLTDWIMVTAVPAVEKFVAQMKSGKGAGGQFADVLGRIKDALAKTTKFLLDHKKEVGLVIAAYATFKATMLLAKVGLVAYEATVKAVKVATAVWTAGQWLLNAALTANPIGLVVVGIGLLVGGFILAYKKSETFRGAVNKAWEALKKFVGFTPLGTLISNFQSLGDKVQWVWDKVQALWGSLQGLIDKVNDFHMPDMPGWLKRGTTAGNDFAKGFKAAWVATKFAVNPMVEVLTDQLNSARDALASFRDRRNALADFSGFGGNLFGADISGGSEGTGPTGVAALQAFAAKQKADAQQLAADVGKLVAMGLSQDLIDQLKSQGAAGLEQIHALAAASPEQVASINADMAAAAAARSQAGMAVTAQMDATMRTMGAGVTELAVLLQKYLDHPTPIMLELHQHLTGKTIVTQIKAEQRATGIQYLVT